MICHRLKSSATHLASLYQKRSSHHNSISSFRSFHTIHLNRQQQQQEITEEQPHHQEEDQTNALDATLTPPKIVEELDRFIVGQKDAKRAVAIAMRNRWRRHRVDPALRQDIIPKNILMVGPTGCGKTEIARRLAKLSDAPFLKVEATKFTEVGYHGRDVDSIIRDLLEVAISQLKHKYTKKNKQKAAVMAENSVIDILCGKDSSEVTRSQYRELLKEGSLDDKVIDVMVPEAEKMSPMMAMGGGSEQMVNLQQLFSMVGGEKRLKKKKMKVKDALPVLQNYEASKMLNMESIVMEAIKSVEQDGIVVIDEVDKICSSSGAKTTGRDASSEGVQRDLLPLIEGTTISTKHGNVNTDHILFIASGAFHSCKPSDLLAEFQGRLPIRVELSGLSEEDLHRVLTEPQYNLLMQNIALLSTENVNLTFEEEAIREIARVAAEINSTLENIGARRLHTVVEKILEQVSFDAPDMTNKGKDPVDFTVTKETVTKAIRPLMKKTDMQKFVL